jgi:hypothetical protein
MVDWLAISTTSPNVQLLPHRPDYTFQSLYHPHILDNIEYLQVFPSDESIFAFIQNEPYKPKEIISIEANKIPKGWNPLESLFSSSDVGNKEKQKEEELKMKVGETIFLNIGTPKSPKNVIMGAQCFDEEKMKFAKLLGEFQYFFLGLMRIFVVLILVSFSMPFPSMKALNQLGKNKDLSTLHWNQLLERIWKKS